MKKLTTLLGIALLVAALAVPAAFAWGPGWGRGHHMTGYWDRGPGYDGYDGRGYGNVTPEQRSRLDDLDRKFAPGVRYGRGRHMMGYGTGAGYDRHMGGYGGGYCWN